MDWIALRLDRRKALILRWRHYSAVVFDLDKLEVVKQCDLQVDGELTLGRWLADVPGRGPSYQAWLSDPDGHAVFRSMALGPDVSCNEWFENKVGPEEVAYINANGGNFNVFGLNSDGTYGRLDQEGNLVKQMGAGNLVQLGIRLPRAESLPEETRSFIGISINNAAALLASYRLPDGRLHSVVLRKRDGTWHDIPDSVGPVIFRGFGLYIALAETDYKPSVSKRIQPKRPAGSLKNLPDAEVSAGAAELSMKERDTGPNMRATMEISEQVYSGKLTLYDVETERVYSIETNQGNSEILLLESKTVYYRINDHLYSAEIGEDGLGAPRLLATDAVINDVHWAFLKH